MLTVICEDWHSTLLWKTLVLPYHFFGSLKLLEHISIGVFVVYIDTGSSVPGVPSTSHDLADENKKTFDGMEMI
jgi:hypothetical protein